MKKLHALTRILNLGMIAAIAALFLSLWVAMLTVDVLNSWGQATRLMSFLAPVTLFLVAPYAVLLRMKREPLATLGQERLALGGSLAILGLAAIVFTQPLYVPDIPALGVWAVLVSPTILSAVQLVVALAIVRKVKGAGPAHAPGT